MEKKLETTIVYWGYIGFRDSGLRVQDLGSELLINGVVKGML